MAGTIYQIVIQTPTHRTIISVVRYEIQGENEEKRNCLNNFLTKTNIKSM